MRTFAPEQIRGRRSVGPSTPVSQTRRTGLDRRAGLILHLHQAIGNQAVQRMLQTDVLELRRAGASLRLSRDYSGTISSLPAIHRAPGTQDGRHSRTYDLADVGVSLQRKVVIGGKQLQNNSAFIKKHKLSSIPLAQSILEDMASATDVFDFQNEQELQMEIVKRSSTVKHMEESQADYVASGAFAYPFTESNGTALYGPRVNYAAREYWEPAVPATFANRDS
jgi:hypothetical protein